METVHIDAVDQLQYFIQQLSTPLGMAMVLLFLLALFAVIFMPVLRWIYLGTAIWTSTLAYYGYAKLDENVLMSPLQQLRDYGRPITVALLIALLIPSLIAQRGIRGKVTCAGLWGLGIYQIIFSARLAAGGDMVHGVLGGLILFITFMVMLLGVTRWVQVPKDADKVINTIVFSVALFVISNIMQLLVNPAAVGAAGGRFYGTTGNPQHAGLILSASIAPLLYFAFAPGRGKLLRLSGILLLIPVVGMTAWTGSRTAALVTLVSLGIMFRLKLGKLIYILPILFISFVVVMQFANYLVAAQFPEYAGLMQSSDVLGFGQHIIDTTDTRSDVWYWTFQTFLANPLYGSATGAVGYTENSYLAIAANFGLVGLLPLLFVLVASCFAMFRVWKLRPQLGPHAAMAEMVVAGLFSLFMGALFEGYLGGTLSFPIYMLYVYLCLIPFLIDLAHRQAFYATGMPVAMPLTDQPYGGYQPQYT